jgi:hypothetical protein
MFITNPNQALKLPNYENAYLLEMNSNMTKFYLKNKNLDLTEKQYNKALDELQEMTNLNFTLEQLKDILSLYPQSRIQLAAHDSYEDLAFAIAHFFLYCSWPTYGDNINLDDFLHLLQTQAKTIYPELQNIA